MPYRSQPVPSPDLPSHEVHAALSRESAWSEWYLEGPGGYPVLSQVAPGDVARQLPASPPDDGEPLDQILDDFERVLLPGVTHWNHPAFFAYFANSAPAAGVLGEMLTAALNVNAMLWKTSPAATELEERALDWLRQMMGLGPGWFGIINDTASTTTLLALAAAREARADLEIRQRGLAGRPELPVLRMYLSEQANLSVDKAIITLGIGVDNCVHIPVDGAYRMRVDASRAGSAGSRDHRQRQSSRGPVGRDGLRERVDSHAIRPVNGDMHAAVDADA